MSLLILVWFGLILYLLVGVAGISCCVILDACVLGWVIWWWLCYGWRGFTWMLLGGCGLWDVCRFCELVVCWIYLPVLAVTFCFGLG